ncbi:glycosyltransferase [Candidatus Roizmanbacteria bacterium]|nr:glycosyltransferase [Candidatus Roizmanbacteria bacterium]
MNSSRLPDEIVVVNDSGPKELRDMLLKLEKKTKLIYAYILPDIPWNYNGACNLGVWLSTGSVIALEDSDHIPGRDAYKEGMKILEERPEVSRVHYQRYWMPIAEVMNKSYEDWQKGTPIGPNQMVSLFRRSVYLTLKGQDERLCGRYGYMAYDWVFKYKFVLKLKSERANFYYIVKDGSEPDMERKMSSENRRFYAGNVGEWERNNDWRHSPHGILNFQYIYEAL